MININSIETKHIKFDEVLWGNKTVMKQKIWCVSITSIEYILINVKIHDFDTLNVGKQLKRENHPN